MTPKFSQESLAFVSSEKAKWAELQFINAIDQLFLSKHENEKLKEQLDEANKRINELVNNNGNE